MIKNIVYIVILSISFTQHAIAQNNAIEKENKIDSLYKVCVDSNGSTVGMITCSIYAGDAWWVELNKYDSLLSRILMGNEKVLFNKTQKDWYKWRSSEDDFAQKHYYDIEGTMWRVISSGRSVEIVRQRALDLKAYYDILTVH